MTESRELAEETAVGEALKISEEDVAAIMRFPQAERLGVTRVAPQEIRTLLEMDGGAWLLPPEQLMQLPEKEVVGRVLLHGCAAAARFYTKPARQTAQSKPVMTAMEALRARTSKMQQKNNAASEKAKRAEKLPNLPEEMSAPASIAQGDITLNAQAEVIISEDKISASVRLLPPQPGGRALRLEELIWALFQSGVRVGVDERFLERIVQFPVYNRLFRVAQGSPAMHGQDGTVRFLFQQEAGLKPSMDEMGNVDFKETNFVESIGKGDLLCEIIAPSKAIDGWDVEGNIIPANEGRPSSIVAGQNVGHSEDGRFLIALCDGQPMLKGGQMIVNEVLTVARVDNSTGNITFFGSVTVQGDVSSGFSINAGGDIVIKGFAESAQLIAGGNVVLLKGMNGAGTGRIEAGLSVRSKFLEQVTVNAGKHVYGDVVLNCNINCGGYMLLSGTKGCVSGGYCRVRKEIQANTLGNEAELETRIEIRDAGGLLDLVEQKQARRELLDAVAKRMEGLAQLLRANAMELESKRAGMIRAIYIINRMSRETRILTDDMEAMRRRLSESTSAGKIVAYRQLFPNVHMTIDGTALRNTQMHAACQVRCNEGKIVFETSLPPRRTEKEE